ncbi:MAG: DNA repair protein RadA [Pseudomonadota bacterium]
MAKARTRFICQECGTAHSQWVGKCDGCGAWNSLVEESTEALNPGGLKDRGTKGRAINFSDLQATDATIKRYLTGIGEFDRVCGGGLVPGGALLVGGDPGIGKSTLMLQVAGALAQGQKVAYVSGEEGLEQIRMRAGRLGLAKAPVGLAAATSVRDIVATMNSGDRPDVLVIDSIQTMFVDSLDSAPGSVGQVRASAQEMIRVAKQRDIAIIIIGHVTKEGTLAGPRVLEHMVDTVLYFEGERGHPFRILRTVKNRFGATDEIGVFEMVEAGLEPVANPSALFLADRQTQVPGTCVFAGIEGTRPLLVEIQALVAPSAYGTPRRAVVGWDSNRLAMILAVLETRCGLTFHSEDIYLNVAGGLRITEPAADMAVAVARISALKEKPAPADMVVFGEIGLTGEIRSVARADARAKEAEKLGFGKAWVPKSIRGKAKKPATSALEIDSFHTVSDLPLAIDDAYDPASTQRRQEPVA